MPISSSLPIQIAAAEVIVRFFRHHDERSVDLELSCLLTDAQWKLSAELTLLGHEEIRRRVEGRSATLVTHHTPSAFLVTRTDEQVEVTFTLLIFAADGKGEPLPLVVPSAPIVCNARAYLVNSNDEWKISRLETDRLIFKGA
jgi:hypothetical protein